MDNVEKFKALVKEKLLYRGFNLKIIAALHHINMLTVDDIDEDGETEKGDQNEHSHPTPSASWERVEHLGRTHSAPQTEKHHGITRRQQTAQNDEIMERHRISERSDWSI